MQKVLTKQCQYFLIFNAEICSVTDIGGMPDEWSK